MTKEKDIVLIYFEDQPTGFARIEDISPDVKKDWYLVKLLILQIEQPLHTITWILRDCYIDGDEFTTNRLLSIIKRNAALEPEKLTTTIRNSLDSFTTGTKQHDDQTLLLMKVN